MTDTIATTAQLMQRISSASHGDGEPLFSKDEVERIRFGLEIQDHRFAVKDGSESILSTHATMEEAQASALEKAGLLDGRQDRRRWFVDLLSDIAACAGF